MDLYPLIYELSMWSLKHIEFEHHNLAVEWVDGNKANLQNKLLKKLLAIIKNHLRFKSTLNLFKFL